MDKIGKLIADLESPDADTRLNAAQDLMHKNDKRAILPLIRKLDSANGQMQSFAAHALGNIGDPSAVQDLLRVMENADWDDHNYAVAEALGKIGDRRAVEPLCKYYSDGYVDEFLTHVAMALGRLGDERAVPALLQMFDYFYELGEDWDEERHVCAVHALGEIGHHDALKPLVDELQSFIDYWKKDNYYIQDDEAAHIIFAEIAWALGMIADSNNHAFNTLIEAMVHLYIPGEPSIGWQMRSKAAEALSWFEDPDAYEPLLKKMNDKKEHQRVRISAIRSLGVLAGEIEGLSPDPFIAVLKDPELMPGNLLREEAVKALGMIGHDKAVDPLAELLWERGQQLALPAASSLVQIGNSRARQALEKFIESSDDTKVGTRLRVAGIRAAVAEELGEMEDRRSVDLLIENLDDWNGDVRAAAASALGYIGDERAAEPLIKLLKREATRDFADDRAAAADALGALERAGPSGEPLAEALEDKSVKVRIAAASALRRYWISPEAMQSLISTLDDDSWDVQDAADESLELMLNFRLNPHGPRVGHIAWQRYPDEMKAMKEAHERFKKQKEQRVYADE
jgi:HEAT repeat protein